MAPLKVGLMGYGFSTNSFHLPFILPNPNLEVYAFLQRAAAPKDPSSTPKGRHCTVDYPHCKHYRDAKSFFGDSAIDLVVVCTAVESHAEYAEMALLAGKHVIVEKPFTVTSQEADKIIAVAKKTGKTLTCFQNRRYDSDFRTLQHLVNQSVFGDVTEFENHYDTDFPAWISNWDSPDYLPGEGMLYGLGTHSIDQCMQLFGRPVSVTAFTRSLRGIKSKTDDSFTLILQYDGKYSDLICTVKTTVVTPQAQQLKFWMRGYKGSFLKNGDDPQESQIAKGMHADADGFGQEEPDIWGLLTTNELFDPSVQTKAPDGKFVGKFPSLKGSYTDYYVDMVRAIRGEAELAVKPEESRDVIRLIELARESAEKGVTVRWT